MESWWFLEAADKAIDGNDNSVMTLVDQHMAAPGLASACEGCNAETGEPCRWGCSSNFAASA